MYTAHLKLEIARLRLSRWGEAAGINHEGGGHCGNLDENEEEFASKAFSEIDRLLIEAKKSLKIEENVESPTKSSARHDDRETLTVLSKGNRLPEKLRSLTSKRTRLSAIKKTLMWPVWDKKIVESLIASITSQMDALEKVFPAQQQQNMLEEGRKLAAGEVAEILKDFDEPSLNDLAGAARNVDPMLEEAGAKALTLIHNDANHFKNISVEDSARALMGNFFSETFTGNVKTISKSAFEGITIRGTGHALLGNQYGGKGPFED